MQERIAFKSKYDKHLKTREHLFNIDCEELSSSPTHLLTKLITRPELQILSTLVASCGRIAITIAGPSTFCIDAGFSRNIAKYYKSFVGRDS